MQLNGDYVAAYMGNQLQLHSVILKLKLRVHNYFFLIIINLFFIKKLTESAIENRESILFPSQENNDGKITGFALVKDYLVYSTDVCSIFILIFS